MYLLYVDESGSPTGDSEHFVLGGAAIFERQTFYLSQHLDDIHDRYFPESESTVEFHASELWGARKEPWKSMSFSEKGQLMSDILDCIANANDPGVALFAVAMHKASFRYDDPVEKALEQLILRFDTFLTRRYRAGDNQRGIMIFDESRFRGRIEALMAQFTKAGTRFGRVKNYCPANGDRRGRRARTSPLTLSPGLLP